MKVIDDIANYFVWFANEHGDLITHLKVQKLCYFAEVFYVAHKGQSLTGEPFEAWVHGPVSKTLWERLKKYQHRPINEEVSLLSEYDTGECTYVKPDVPEEIEAHLEKVIAICWGVSAWELECLSHEHVPWKNARKDLKPYEHCDRQIMQDDIREFYTEYVKENSMEEFYPIAC